MTVGELYRRIDSRELSEWMAYELVAGPLGQSRDDHLTALISSTVANAMKGKGEPIPPHKFMPDWDGGNPNGDDS